VFGVGAFARLAQVSVRTLRYYDEVGLLRPANVDPRTSYRWYRADQLHRLNRILALRDLGLALAEIRRVVDDDVSVSELRGMLRLRQSEARQRLEAETATLARVEARLHQIEAEDRVGDYDVVVKRLESLRVAFLAENAASFGDETLGPIFSRLYDHLHAALARAQLTPAGPAVALYADSGDEDAPITVMAALPVRAADDVAARAGVELLELPAVPRAATTIHKGPMSRVEDGYQALARWADHAGERIEGHSRELYLDCDGDSETWVTELQFPIGEAR
jgi:DNA-binding transcriptional MerR regulator